MYLADRSLTALVGLLLAAVVAVGLATTLVVAVADLSDATAPDVFVDVLLALIGVESVQTLDDSGASSFARVVIGVVSFLLPPLFLGVIVFKFFTIDPIEYRKAISLTHYYGEPVFAVRFYNRLPVELYDLTIRAYLRVPSTNLQSPSLQNRQLRLRPPGNPDSSEESEALMEMNWPVALRHVPFMLRISTESAQPLALGAGEMPSELMIQGYNAPIETTEIFLYIEGEIPQIGEPFTSYKRYSLARDAEVGRPAQIDLDYRVQSNDWPGWDRFDDTEELLVFGYGSLVHREHLEAFLGRRLDDTEFQHAVLFGYRRRWNVAMDNSVVVEGYKNYQDGDGNRPPVMVCFLGLEEASAGIVNGVVFRVSDDEMRRLEIRERNYDNVDVTDKVKMASPILRPKRVITFVPRPDAVRRAEQGRAEGTLRVTSSYVDVVEEGFRTLGSEELDRYRADDGDEPPTVDLMRR